MNKIMEYDKLVRNSNSGQQPVDIIERYSFEGHRLE